EISDPLTLRPAATEVNTPVVKGMLSEACVALVEMLTVPPKPAVGVKLTGINEEEFTPKGNWCKPLVIFCQEIVLVLNAKLDSLLMYPPVRVMAVVFPDSIVSACPFRFSSP